MEKYICHIDLNMFFAAAQILLEPELEGKPLIIASSSRRGIVSTASYEARKYGIHSAMPTYQAKLLCKNLEIRKPNFALYQSLSNTFFTYIKEHYSSILEQASIDEAYIDLTDYIKQNNVSSRDDLYSLLKEIQDTLLKETKLKCSIGLGPTRFLAKMGSDYKKPLGITIINKDDIKRMIYPLKIEDFYGIGKRSYPKLHTLGIYSIEDFALNKSPLIKKMFGKYYEEMISNLEGTSSSEIKVDRGQAKSVSSSSTFEYDTDSYEEIREMILKKSMEVASDLKKQHLMGKTISLIIKDYRFKSFNRSLTIDSYVNDYLSIYETCMELYDKEFTDCLIRLVGVGVSSLINEKDNVKQVDIFEEKSKVKTSPQLLVKQLNYKNNKEIFILAKDLNKGKKDEK